MRHGGLLGALTAAVTLLGVGWRIWKGLSADTRTEVKLVAKDQVVTAKDQVVDAGVAVKKQARRAARKVARPFGFGPWMTSKEPKRRAAVK